MRQGLSTPPTYFWATTKGFRFENSRRHELMSCKIQLSACFYTSMNTLHIQFLTMTSLTTPSSLAFSSASTTSLRTPPAKPALKRIFKLGDKTPISSPGTHWTNDKCLIVFPNYVTEGLTSAECTLAVQPQVEFFLKRAHAERACKTPPLQSLTERTAADLLLISISTLHSWVRKGLLYRWVKCGQWAFSNAEVQALMLSKHRAM